MVINRVIAFSILFLSIYFLNSCSTTVSEATSKRQFNISFVSTNVLGKGLIVQINGGNDLVVDRDGTYYFSLKLKNGDFFAGRRPAVRPQGGLRAEGQL